MDADVLAWLLLGGDHVGEIAFEQGSVSACSPGHRFQRLGDHVLWNAVDMVCERLNGRSRPVAFPLLIFHP